MQKRVDYMSTIWRADLGMKVASNDRYGVQRSVESSASFQNANIAVGPLHFAHSNAWHYQQLLCLRRVPTVSSIPIVERRAFANYNCIQRSEQLKRPDGANSIYSPDECFSNKCLVFELHTSVSGLSIHFVGWSGVNRENSFFWDFIIPKQTFFFSY